MKLCQYLPVWLLIGSVGLVNCVPKKTVKETDAALLFSTVTIGDIAEFTPQTPIYARLELQLEGVNPTVLSQTLAYSKNFLKSKVEFTKFKIPYGSYRLSMKFFDTANKLVYQSCFEGKKSDGSPLSDESSRIHVVDQPTYEPVIYICSEADGKASPSSQEQDKEQVEQSPPRQTFPADAKFYVDTNSTAARDSASVRRQSATDARYLDYIAKQGAGAWLGEWSGNVGQTVSQRMQDAQRQNSFAVFVVYMIPNRDCGQFSAGGARAADYRGWIDQVANAIGDGKAIVVVEPDAVPGLLQKTGGRDCLSPALKKERIELINYAVEALKSKPNTFAYIDIGHPFWLSVDQAADLLKQTGIAKADGFTLNVSNYQPTELNIAYGKKILAKIGNKGFIVDTSRNGVDPQGSTEWCNPRNRGLGQPPTFNTGINAVDAFIWAKVPGESDGNCNGGPAAGQWWREQALELARNAKI